MKNVGVDRLLSRASDERCAVKALTVATFWLRIASCAIPYTVGSHVCTDWRKFAIAPVFGQPCGTSASYRSVQVIVGMIALNGTPSTAALITAPPPSEKPIAPT